MNINNLRTFVNALNKLPDEVKNNEVDMLSIIQPICGAVGCHAGLVSIVADYIPELKFSHPQCGYSYFEWANTLAEFLGFDSRISLRDWAYDNPEIWGNEDGYGMFTECEAFGQKTNTFKHSVIIDHWTAVLKRVEQSNNK